MTHREQIDTAIEGMDFIFKQNDMEILPFVTALLIVMVPFIEQEPLLKKLIETYMSAAKRGELVQFCAALITVNTLREEHQTAPAAK